MCAREEGKLIGTQAFIPIRMIDTGGVYWTAKSEATLIDFKYWGQHLLEKMYDPLLEYADKHDFAFVWGFTPAVKAFAQLPFEFPGKTEQLFLPFSSRSVTALANKGTVGESSFVRTAAIKVAGSMAATLSSVKMSLNRKQLPQSLTIRTMEEADEQAGAVCEKFIKQWGGNTIYRDARYLKWRLFDNPYGKSIVKGVYDNDELLGWVAFTLGDDGIGYLVDLMVACDSSKYFPGRLVRSLLMEAVRGSRNMGASGIRTWRVNEHPFEQLVAKEARRLGFYHIKRGYSAVLLTCPSGLRRKQAEKFDNWYVTRIYTEGALS